MLRLRVGLLVGLVACSPAERAEVVPDERGPALTASAPAASSPSATASSGAASAVPAIPPAQDRRLGCGTGFACAIHDDGRVACWGYDTLGQLGGGVIKKSGSRGAAIVSGLPPARAVAVGLTHACALSKAGDVHCWGLGSEGQLGDGAPVAVEGAAEGTPPHVGPARPVTGLPGKAVAIDASNLHTCAVLEGGAVACWGDNMTGGLGAAGASSSTPTVVDGVRDAAEIACGDDTTCARSTRGEVTCWGRGGGGTPTPVAGLCARQVTVTGTCACAIDCDGEVRCWGDLPGYDKHSDAPKRIEALGDIREIRGGWSHLVARDGSGRLFAWGGNDSGQIGNGKPADWMSAFADEPVQVPIPWKVGSDVCAGGITARQDGRYLRVSTFVDAGISCARSDAGDVYCWGEPDLDYVPKKVAVPR